MLLNIGIESRFSNMSKIKTVKINILEETNEIKKILRFCIKLRVESHCTLD